MREHEKEIVRAFKKYMKAITKEECKISEEFKKQFASDSVVNSGKEPSSHPNKAH